MRTRSRLSTALAVFATTLLWQPGAASAATMSSGLMSCSAGSVDFTGPTVVTTQNQQGSTANVMMYPQLLRFDGQQWVLHAGGPWFFDEPAFPGGVGLGGVSAWAGPEWATSPGHQGYSSFSFPAPSGHWWAVRLWVYDRGEWLSAIAGQPGAQVCKS